MKLEAEREETRIAKRRAEVLENELMDVREQLKDVAAACELENRKSSKYEVKSSRIVPLQKICEKLYFLPKSQYFNMKPFSESMLPSPSLNSLMYRTFHRKRCHAV